MVCRPLALWRSGVSRRTTFRQSKIFCKTDLLPTRRKTTNQMGCTHNHSSQPAQPARKGPIFIHDPSLDAGHISDAAPSPAQLEVADLLLSQPPANETTYDCLKRVLELQAERVMAFLEFEGYLEAQLSTPTPDTTTVSNISNTTARFAAISRGILAAEDILKRLDNTETVQRYVRKLQELEKRNLEVTVQFYSRKQESTYGPRDFSDLIKELEQDKRGILEEIVETVEELRSELAEVELSIHSQSDDSTGSVEAGQK
ncbi:hypothetical protein DFS34DRAFT_358046 [Phlyctochytrium arcticum]|nr:hypothetical protein DFS34DRAFT_358046 [Phlyctochytrium arcticum]